MPRRSGFISSTIRIAKTIEANQRRAQNEAIRKYNAEIRHQQALQRQIEKEKKLAEKERIRKEKERAIQYSIGKTNEAEEIRQSLVSILRQCVIRPMEFSWNQFKKYDDYPKPEPREPQYEELPKEINKDNYSPDIKLLDKIFKKRLKAKVEASNQQIDKAITLREEQVREIKDQNEELEKRYKEEINKWRQEEENFKEEQNAFNKEIDKQKRAFNENDKEAVELYFDTILNSNNLLESLLTSWIICYSPEEKILIVDYDIPDKDIIPSLKMMKYIITRKEFTETVLKEKEIDQIYNEILFQLSLRITNDLYVSDINEQLNSIVFNGIYTGINKSTGNEETKCIMSIQTLKQEFTKINLSNVDPKLCFLKFKGISGTKLSEFVPVAPILTFDKEDSRFVEGKDVLGIINGINLASMNWEDFEHLIRVLFEKEFAINGAEIRVTQASRDGGVDAVMFDPDPIRGGKYIIQAKRYTNVVGVSAVRDLYGTIMNEGAVKGILVTTANYGADSYEFAKDKPITLINGNNLLHMLQKHGYQARIDIEEARKTLTEEK